MPITPIIGINRCGGGRLERKIYSDVAVMIEDVDLFKGNILWIDGFNGSGKSHLADQIAAALSEPCQVLHLDHFLVEEQGVFFDSLNMADVSAAINSHSGLLIVEGVCLSRVREHLGIKDGMTIYVRRIGTNGLWYEEEECQIDSEKMIFCDTNPFAIELRQYHYDYRPYEHADYIFDRIETPA